MSEKPQCSQSVPERGSRWPRFFQCSRSGKVQRDGKWYCAIHDPEKKKAKQKAWNDAYEAEKSEQERIYAETQVAAKKIGVGKPYFDNPIRGKSGYRRALVLTLEEIEQLTKATR